ncbi:short chain dehydrogenase [Rhizoctonia solani]|uniref:Short chain dehydrogenase n=1 Tax=Rhizoctonia solani TaxID=456999 RepID=A0A8H8NTQ1_9AGAM|nr:short chain dehydrogenase [Rhizoctonia solani]QRW19175.1 short chain dehydrogenase [Rhizoctonia solani]
MPYSEHAHYAPVGSALSIASQIRNGLGNFIIPLLHDMPPPSADLRGKQAIVTGANSGIGFETAKSLAKLGARVILACRNKDKAEKARNDIEQAVKGAQVEVEILDCASLGSARLFAERWGKRSSLTIDILINNAGRVLNTRTTTIDGYEDTYQTNHLTHALLTLSLLKLGYLSPNARIVNVSSISFFSSPPFEAQNTDASDMINRYEEGAVLPWEMMIALYSRAKACQAIWSMTLQRKLQGAEKWKGIVVQACHPGMDHNSGTVKSSMLSQPDGAGGSSGAALNAFKSFVNTFGISNGQGAVVPVWLAVSDEPTKPELRATYFIMQDLESTLNDLSSSLETLSTLNEGEPPLELDTESSEALVTWKSSTLKILERLENVLNREAAALSLAERARVISLAAVFIGQDNFTNEACRAVAQGKSQSRSTTRPTEVLQGCLGSIDTVDRAVATRVLNDYIKPLFQASVHPGVHLDTGRMKHNAISVQSMYDEQPWKVKGSGSWSILVWVLWSINKAPSSLLRRTGVDELLFKSLRGALQNLTSDSSPELLCTAMPCYLTLVDLVLPNDDLNRYAKLTELITDVIIPGWLYASSRVDVMVASVSALSLVVQALGSGSIRFLKAIIPQLTENLTPKEFSPVQKTRELQIASAKCMLLVTVNARPRIPYWR